MSELHVSVPPILPKNSLVKLFDSWKERCLSASNDHDSTSILILQGEAKSSFAIFEVCNFENEMVSLIQSLKPCFDSSMSQATKYFALSCLVGSVQGCFENAGASRETPILSISLVKQISDFFLSIALPLDSESNYVTNVNMMSPGLGNECDREQIRDLAVSGLISLIKCTAISSQSTESNDSISYRMIDELTAHETLQLQLYVAVSGVKNRCAVESHATARFTNDNGDNHDDEGFDYAKPVKTVESGLSMLPRARRSACFSLLHVSVDSAYCFILRLIDSELNKSATRESVFEFIKFVAKCLHGESDPRCLLQLLQLLHASLTTFYRLFNGNKVNRYSKNVLIISNVFESVSPYYPVQFNPPPNDVYGITRSSLRESIIRVLSCSLYDDPCNNSNDNMTSLSCGLILDCLNPIDCDEPLSFKEQIEILEDLNGFLFGDDGSMSNLQMLDVTLLENVSNVLFNVHEKASLAVSGNGNHIVDGSNTETSVAAKNLADFCRTVIAKIATATEVIATPDKWHVFVEKPVRTFSTHLGISISRMPIAHIACLASSGGFRTLILCLDAGLTPLLKYLKFASQEAVTDSVVIAIYGVGALFSSCRVAIEKASSDGIFWHPHPLDLVCNESLDRILEYLAASKIASDGWDPITDVRIAAVRSLESIFLIFPLHMITTNQTIQLLSLFRQLSPRLLNAVQSSKIDDLEELQAYSQAFGSFLGLSLHFEAIFFDEPNTSKTNIFQLEPLRNFFLNELLPSLLLSARWEIVSSTKYVLSLIGTAASYSRNASSRVIQQLATSLHSAITAGEGEMAESLGGILGFLFKQKNSYSAEAYQNLSSPNITAFDVVTALTLDAQRKSRKSEAQFGMNTLQLPISNEDRQEIFLALDKAYCVVKQLRKGYEVGLSKNHLQKLFAMVDQVLPPLCEADTVKLSIVLPLLSAALEGWLDDLSSFDPSEDQIPVTIRDLTDFALAEECHPIARLHAARCLYAVLARFSSFERRVCPAHALIKKQLYPALRDGLSAVVEAKSKSHARVISPFLYRDYVNILALISSASAYRGGVSSKTSDSVAFFLIDIACIGKSVPSICDLNEDAFDFTDFDVSRCNEKFAKISAVAASAFGSILNSRCTGNTLWKQRLIHLSLQRVIDHYGCIEDECIVVDQAPIGLFCIMCHLACWSSLDIVTANHQATMFSILTTSLSPKTLQATDLSTIQLFLVAIIKLIRTASPFIRGFHQVIVGAIRTFASVDESSDGILCKILALQVLAVVAYISESNFSALDTIKALRPAILSLLGTTLEHPSSAVRLAGVEVRNTWYVLGT